MRFPIRNQGSTSQASSFPYYVKQPSAPIVRSPLVLSTLVLPDPSGRRKSPTRTSSSSIAPALQLPEWIHAPQSSLPQLTAEVTCLFWFENGNTLRQVESSSLHAMSPATLSLDSHPSIGFRKWVATLLSTTQVTRNVVLLALFFIYKLKSFNPNVKGKPGSEYRLLTVALMLGNKFLDDNTYTNKTWAEVSGISVQEVHIMEVEFLSNMRYSLFTSEKQWRDWHEKLGKFGTYIHHANQAWENATRPGPLSTTSMHLPTALPSPPVSHNASPPYVSSYSPVNLPRSNTPILLPQLNSTVVSPMRPLPELDPRFSRKRSYDEHGQEPPLKRHAPYPNTLPHPASMSSSLTPINHAPTLPRVALPSLSIPPLSQAPPVQLAPQLPVPSGRAMSMVYPPPIQWQQPGSMPTSVPSLQTAGLPPPQLPHIDTRQLSPYPGQSATSSPVSATFTPTSQSQNRLSPSYFLQQRSSPYRPVRQVQTLLVPPASTSMQHAPQMVAQNQMQYHPLGKPMNERRVGHLPYIHSDAWPETQQYHQWHELPPLSQPVFQ
ncbi:hypothetical protein EJ08DRAFT_591154 [Tothia fuscella]|uniref:Cyclin n=1 Tax=Tothia fuscella TaxID=1048955 RepID=A0A9P4NPJ4_9PEZI|nr:hypothetical protein EJ08DRAFT_591154 [Tothia fuscella]